MSVETRHGYNQVAYATNAEFTEILQLIVVPSTAPRSVRHNVRTRLPPQFVKGRESPGKGPLPLGEIGATRGLCGGELQRARAPAPLAAGLRSDRGEPLLLLLCNNALYLRDVLRKRGQRLDLFAVHHCCSHRVSSSCEGAHASYEY